MPIKKKESKKVDKPKKKAGKAVKPEKKKDKAVKKEVKASKKKDKAVKPEKKEVKAVKPEKKTGKQQIITIRSKSDTLDKTNLKVVHQHNDYISKLVNSMKVENEVDPTKSIRYGWNF